MSDLKQLKAQVDATINLADERRYFGASVKYQRALEAEVERVTRERDEALAVQSEHYTRQVQHLQRMWDDATAEVERLIEKARLAEMQADQTACVVDEYKTEVERLATLCRVSGENHRSLWAALRMVRDAIEEVGPAGILPDIEHEGVEPGQVAEHFVAAIVRIAALAGEGDEDE